MYWDAPHRRSVGLAIEVIRVRWIYGILATLAQSMPLYPGEIIARIEELNRRNTPIIGARILDHDRIIRKILMLHRGGLLTRIDGHASAGMRTTYGLTSLGAGLLNSFDTLGRWAVGRYEHLVRLERSRHGLDEAAPIPPADVADPFTVHLATRLAIGTLGSRWAFAVLAHTSFGQAGPGMLEAQVNAALAEQPDLVGRRHLSLAALHEALARLTAAGLVEREEHRHEGRPPWVQYRCSELGYDMLRALWPVATWGVEHDAQLFRVLALRAGWPEGDG